MRKNNDRYPRHKRDSDDKGTQNKGPGFARNYVSTSVAWLVRSIWAGVSCCFGKIRKLKNYYVDIAVNRNISIYSLKARSEQANQSPENYSPH